MMPLLFRRSGGGASSATEAGAAAATAALLLATPAFGPLPLLPLVVLLLPLVSWEPLLRLDMVGPRPRPGCWGSLPTMGVLRQMPGPAAHNGDAWWASMLRAGTWSAVHVEVSSLGSQSRPSRHRRCRREDEGEGRGGEQRSALGTAAAVRSSPAPPPAEPGSGAGVTPPRLARGGEGGEPAAPAPPPPPRGPN